VIWQNLVVYPWQTGDVVAIDNNAVGHGRLPYQGPRRIAQLGLAHSLWRCRNGRGTWVSASTLPLNTSYASGVSERQRTVRSLDHELGRQLLTPSARVLPSGVMVSAEASSFAI
jgi:hypothetical protein